MNDKFVTTGVLLGHVDEIWKMEWSHSGTHLASGSADKTAIIWSYGSETRTWEVQLILKAHLFPVHSLAWSLDDSMLLTGSEHYIKLWDTKTGSCLRTLDEHTDTVTALSWLPDDSGFISGALDCKVIQWDTAGDKKLSWAPLDLRVVDLAVTPDLSRAVIIGMQTSSSSSEIGVPEDGGVPSSPDEIPSTNNKLSISHRCAVYQFSTRQVESSVEFDNELTSVNVSEDSQYALINHAPNEINLWDLRLGRLARKFTGQKQGWYIIQSCFGDEFVASGSEDGNVYVWNRDTGLLLDVLAGHGSGSVNSVAWNPRNERMFASCSDDQSIRIWERPAVN